jgi:hypothetical protein
MNVPDERADELADLTLPEAGSLSEEKTRFVEGMGRYFEQFGLSRIGGRLLGLLMIAEEPLSLDDMATTLSVSRASISTNIRIVTTTNLAALVTKPGDRRDCYQFTQDAWGHALRAEMNSLPPLRRMATRALAALGPPGVGRHPQQAPGFSRGSRHQMRSSSLLPCPAKRA